MNVKEFLADDRFLSEECRSGKTDPDPEIRKIMSKMAMRRRVQCADGFHMSIQYSPHHYCNAREPFMGGEWADQSKPWPQPKTVEIGFPSRYEPAIKEYAEEGKTPLFGNLWAHPFKSWSWRWRDWVAKKLPWLTKSNYTNTVYGWVPIDLVEYVVQRHGGITHVHSDSFATWEPV